MGYVLRTVAVDAVAARTVNFFLSGTGRNRLRTRPPAWSTAGNGATVSINISPNGVHADAPTAKPAEAAETEAAEAAETAESVEVTEKNGATVLTLPVPPVLPGQPAAPVSHASIDLPVSAEAAWPVLSDLSRIDEWLTIHDEWATELPAELAAGAELVQQVTLTGWSGAVSWKVDEFRSPSLLRLTGTGLRDAGVKLELTVQPIGYWSRVIAELEFTGEAAEGAAGIVLELGGTRELEASLTNLEHLVAP